MITTEVSSTDITILYIKAYNISPYHGSCIYNNTKYIFYGTPGIKNETYILKKMDILHKLEWYIDEKLYNIMFNNNTPPFIQKLLFNLRYK